MLSICSPDRLHAAGRTELSDALERGEIVAFPVSPVPFPSEGDLRFLREELPGLLRGKNVSFHPESDRVVGLGASRGVRERAREILREHSRNVRDFLRGAIPVLAEGWKVGTSSFRPLEEKGRALSVRASNERLHVDAGAYGATHGDRILRFFMNANPTEDRVWMSKGPFPALFRRYGEAAGVATGRLGEGPLDRLLTGVLNGIAGLGLPMARMLDSSPYDRRMRRFHNFMKESRELQETKEGREELAFKPYSAWMVFTDMVSHACLSGRHAFIDTFIVPLRNCRFPELSPFHVLGREAAAES